MISYIVPVYNGSASIGKCIEHILSQKGEFDRQVIIVNDGSSDNTSEIVSKYPVNLFNRPHLGASSTRNYGISQATGDYIAMIDSDTFLDSDWTLKCLEQDPTTYDILSTNDIKSHPDSPHIRSLINNIETNPYVTFDNLIGFIGNGTFLPARSKSLIQYDPMYIVGGEDTDLLFTLIEKGVKIKAVMGPNFLHKHAHRSNTVKYLSYIKKRICFAYGNVRTWIKHPDVEYARRDGINNIWVLPLYPFIVCYKRFIFEK
jgi:glycosyltransferase involved in cell wall biosynthesis